MQAQSLPKSESIREFVQRVCENISEAEIVSRRDWRLVVRARWGEGEPVIIKLWARPDARGLTRRIFGISAAHYEWQNLRRLSRFDVRVPTPIGFFRLPRRCSEYTEALVMEDMGACEVAINYLKRCIRDADQRAQLEFEDSLIQMTAAMVEADVLDWDHTLVNIVVGSNSQPVRLDLEQARIVRWYMPKRRQYARMLGRLLGSYVFAVQPETYRAEHFARRLLLRLAPPPRVRRLIQSEINSMLARQYGEIGLDTRFSLPASNVESDVRFGGLPNE